MNILKQLEMQEHLTPNEKTLVDYILNNSEAFLNQDIHEICQACYVSSSVVYRLARKLDCAGLADLKVRVSLAVRDFSSEKSELDYDYPVKPHQTPFQVTKNIQELYRKTIQATANLIDYEEIQKITHQMKKAHAIDIYTSAGNLYFAQNFKFQMQEIGKTVHVPEEEYLQRISAASSDPGHLAIVISFGGRGAVMRAIVELLQRQKTPLVLISSTTKNALTDAASYHLYLSSYEHHYHKISSYGTRLSLLYLLDCLYTCYFELDYEKNIQNKLDYYHRLQEVGEMK